ncbi:hypothetical protein L1887_51782 [Cichorium endivia]|nr:hypothetical protein L1887_51782 [Cichorium endivia]
MSAAAPAGRARKNMGSEPATWISRHVQRIDRQGGHQPASADLVHPGADVGRDGRDPQQAEGVVAQGGSRRLSQRMNIKTKLTCAFGVLAVIPVALIACLVVYNLNEQARDGFVDTSGREIRQIDNTVNVFLDSIAQNVAQWADDPQIPCPAGTLHPATPRRTRPPRSCPMARTDGNYVAWPDDAQLKNYDPRKRPWYQLAVANPGQGHAHQRVPVGQGSIDLHRAPPSTAPSGEVIGVMGTDVSLGQLAGFIGKTKLGESGYLMLVEDHRRGAGGPEQSGQCLQAAQGPRRRLRATGRHQQGPGRGRAGRQALHGQCLDFADPGLALHRPDREERSHGRRDQPDLDHRRHRPGPGGAVRGARRGLRQRDHQAYQRRVRQPGRHRPGRGRPDPVRCRSTATMKPRPWLVGFNQFLERIRALVQRIGHGLRRPADRLGNQQPGRLEHGRCHGTPAPGGGTGVDGHSTKWSPLPTKWPSPAARRRPRPTPDSVRSAPASSKSSRPPAALRASARTCCRPPKRCRNWERESQDIEYDPRHHPLDCRADQPAGAERGDRGGAGGRAGTWICRGGR